MDDLITSYSARGNREVVGHSFIMCSQYHLCQCTTSHVPCHLRSASAPCRWSTTTCPPVSERLPQRESLQGPVAPCWLAAEASQARRHRSRSAPSTRPRMEPRRRSSSSSRRNRRRLRAPRRWLPPTRNVLMWTMCVRGWNACTSAQWYSDVDGRVDGCVLRLIYTACGCVGAKWQKEIRRVKE